MHKIKNTLYIKYFQAWIILGLVTGIVLAITMPTISWPTAEAVVYEKPTDTSCDITCEVEQRTERIFEEDRNDNMEQARLKALIEMKDYLVSQIDNSPYYDYQAMSEKYGY